MTDKMAAAAIVFTHWSKKWIDFLFLISLVKTEPNLTISAPVFASIAHNDSEVQSAGTLKAFWWSMGPTSNLKEKKSEKVWISLTYHETCLNLFCYYEYPLSKLILQFDMNYPDSSWLAMWVSHYQNRCGYCKSQYCWGYYEGTLQLLHAQ